MKNMADPLGVESKVHVRREFLFSNTFFQILFLFYFQNIESNIVFQPLLLMILIFSSLKV